MELHKNARSCPASRMLLIQRIQAGIPVTSAAEAAGVSRRTASGIVARLAGRRSVHRRRRRWRFARIRANGAATAIRNATLG